MTDTIVVAGFSLIGTLAGTFGGILTANRLISYRVEQLEKKLDKVESTLNGLVGESYKFKETATVLDEKIKVANHRIDDLENYHKPQ